MKDSRILSTFQDLPSTLGTQSLEEMPEHIRARDRVFDTCQVGVVLRAVLFVEAVVAVGAMFGTSLFVDWLLRFSLLTGGVLPATLAWLIAALVPGGIFVSVLNDLTDRADDARARNAGRRCRRARGAARAA